jgi:ATP-dependent Clp protease ATP-binding subunit ClpB
MVRLDMSEYMEKHSISRMIGAPPGYVGYEEGGQLTKAVRRKPYSVILFDEIEKAHSDVFNVLLQILDDGRVTDSQGRTVDFKNCVIIMTSNIGSHQLLEGIDAQGVISEKAREHVMTELRAGFRPEFLNRVDDVVLFAPLTADQIEKIVVLQAETLRKRLSDRDIDLVLTDEAVKHIAQAGFEPAYGARPLKRYMQRTLETAIGRLIIKGELGEGYTLKIEAQGGELKLLPQQVHSTQSSEEQAAAQQ